MLFTLIALSADAQRSFILGKLYWNHAESNVASNQIVEYSGIPLEIFIYPLLTKAEVDMEDGSITKIYGSVIQRVLSSWNGTFKIKVPPGSYSVFVLYRNRYYGNLQDVNGNLSPVHVDKKGKYWITITMDYSSYH